MIKEFNHDVQLHLHPEWTDEIRPLVFAGATSKRQNLSFYSLAEQTALIKLGMELLGSVGCDGIKAFRAGSFASNHDTYRALHSLGIHIDSSIHAVLPHSAPDLRGSIDFHHPLVLEKVRILPMTIFKDGFGRSRPAQVGACGFAEMRDAIISARNNGTEHFVILSHNFEMLKQGRAEPDMWVVSRFEQLCAFLASQRDTIDVCTFSNGGISFDTARPPPFARASVASTLRRHGEQAIRRLSN